MKQIFLAAVLLLVLGTVRAQKVYFIYIQSENNTPFFVKMGDKVTSATAAGYLILPKLVDSVYQFTVGKTGQASTESRFSVTINKKDRGFLLRETDGKLSLFDLQAMTSLQPLAAANTSTEVIGKRTDPFTVLLAQAANDPSLLEVRAAPAVAVQTEEKKKPEPAVAVTKAPEGPTPKEPEGDTTTQATKTTPDTVAPAETEVAKKTETEPDVKNRDTAQQAETVKTEVASTAEREDTAQQTVSTETAPPTKTETTPVYKPSIVTRRSESSTSEGFGLVFLDETDGVVDTIRIMIPNSTIMVVQKEESKDGDSKKFLDMVDADTSKTAITVEAANEKIRAAEMKKRKACAASASERDFFKLRRDMASEESDEAMIKEARKAFRKTCFSTEQIRNLSSLFLTASGKYHFFDAAYGHVSDQEQYAGLQSLLNDEYYVNRFKILIARQ